MIINSIFQSISGEVGAIPQGAVTTFVRFQGCNLRCVNCDTKHSWGQEYGYLLNIDEIISQVKTQNVILTGGEPLIQDGIYDLINRLGKLGHTVQVETNGTIKFDDLTVASYVVDRKMFLFEPDPYDQHNSLCWHDWLKYVVSSHEELNAAIGELVWPSGHNRAISVVNSDSVTPKIPYNEVITKLVQYGLDDVVINFQIHKLAGLS